MNNKILDNFEFPVARMVYRVSGRRVVLTCIAVICLAAHSNGQSDDPGQDPQRSAVERNDERPGGARAGDEQRGRRGPRGQQRPGGQAGGPAGIGGGPAGQRRGSAPQPEKPAEVKVKKITPALPQSVADQISWRSIGPANMSGRITSIAVYEKDPCIWWAASASGGLLKTKNNGVTFEHQFDKEATVSIGDVQVSQSNPEIVWVGTGESNPRNSVSWGDGVYKSIDGGKTWKNMGLKKSFQTGALAIHPEKPDTVWVGSLGRLWGPNTERGLFKTIDGGKTWKKVLYINDVTGVIDVQLNPKNPDEMLVATYERKRDGFDGNDPVQRFGAGSGIYKSTDGGDSFQRISEGLPGCKMGRIGLDYFASDPNYVVAIVESEKIAMEPENYSFAGIRGEDADVGARVVSITKEGPSEKAGLKVGDIVVSVDGRVVPSYRELLREMHKHLAGETVKLVVSRERKLVDIDLKLGKKPEPAKPNENSTSRRSSRTDFTGTLGGQRENLQETQGPDGHEYGGVYLSEDGGSSWKRINSLNPRPMYYSNIQIDPVDRNNIYVCGTSLYKSKDGGKTFTGDGGTDGIHVDHHALWIDGRDPRHIILGNDGGIYITYDRMEHWDHYNHVAIGQFYHVGVDSNLDYNVYGGLQDNGSWGGPSRSKSGSGPVNSDWFRVGGGDGFITRADPEDSKQIYFESQNGGMGRIHLETGARGFIRPQERGKSFRFNWKTPFILSPHNSKIHYSAGNYVFRSLNKGSSAKRISPEITNTDKGAGSAMSESPLEAGVIYVGTTDGAVFMTKDGGANWNPLFYNPEKKEKPDEETKTDSKETDKDKVDKESAAGIEADPSDPVTGTWKGLLVSDRIPEDRAGFGFKLKLENGIVSGQYDGREGPVDISEGKFDSDTGAISFAVEGQRGTREFSGTVKDGKMTGEMSVADGRFTLPFEATRSKKDPKHAHLFRSELFNASLISISSEVRYQATDDDPVSGVWRGVVESDDLPGGQVEFSLTISMDDEQNISGTVNSPDGDADITDGTFNPETSRILISAETERFILEFKADVAESSMIGTVEVNDGQLEADFSAKREAAAKGDATPSQEQQEAEAADEKEIGKTPEQKPAEPKQEKEQPSAEASDDLISGSWTGQMTSSRAEQDVTVVLKRRSDSDITGTFESSRGERDITRGSYDPESQQLTLAAETDQFTMEFRGTVTENVYSGELDLNSGAFTMEFSLERTGAAESETGKSQEPKSEEEPKVKLPPAPTGEKSLSGIMPGPRWVSSLEASRFKKERCYLTFDGHRSDDDEVYVFVTNDYGVTWESLRNNLPESAGSVRVIREDLVNENLLYLGCEFSAWYSIDAGQTWTRIKGGLPTVAVHEFAIHPNVGDVVAATHGRSLWVADVTVLRQLNKTVLAEDAHLYEPKDAIRWQQVPSRGSSGTRRFVGKNPDSGTTIAYSLGKTARQIELRILNLNGDTVKTFEAPTSRGVHLLNWDLRRDSGGRSRQSVPSGEYLIKLRVDGETQQATVAVKTDPGLSAAARAEMERTLGAEDSAMIDEGID